MKGLSNNSLTGFLGLSKVLRRRRLGLPDAKDRGGRDGWLCGGFILCRDLWMRVVCEGEEVGEEVQGWV